MMQDGELIPGQSGQSNGEIINSTSSDSPMQYNATSLTVNTNSQKSKIDWRDKINLGGEYGRATRMAGKAWKEVAEAVNTYIHDEQGEIIQPEHFIAGIRLGGKLSYEEAQALETQLRNSLAEEFGAYDEMQYPQEHGEQIYAMFNDGLHHSGRIGLNIQLPFVTIPQVNYDVSQMKPIQAQKITR